MQIATVSVDSTPATALSDSASTQTLDMTCLIQQQPISHREVDVCCVYDDKCAYLTVHVYL